MAEIVYADYDGEHRWPSWQALAAAYWEDDEGHESASDCVFNICYDGDPRWLQALEAVVAAAPVTRLGEVGAGPLEDLLSHGRVEDRRHFDFVSAVDERARRDPRWRTAVANLWLDEDVPAEVRRRLGRYGATDLSGDRQVVSNDGERESSRKPPRRGRRRSRKSG